MCWVSNWPVPGAPRQESTATSLSGKFQALIVLGKTHPLQVEDFHIELILSS